MFHFLLLCPHGLAENLAGIVRIERERRGKMKMNRKEKREEFASSQKEVTHKLTCLEFNGHFITKPVNQDHCSSKFDAATTIESKHDLRK